MHKIDTAHLAHLKELGEVLLSHSDSTIPLECADSLIRSFLREAGYVAFATPLNPLNTWYRARPQSPGETIKDHLSELLYRLKPASTFGRAHAPGERVCYAAWNSATAEAEVDMGSSSWVWTTHFRPRASTRVIGCMVGAYEYFYRTGRLHYPSASIERQMQEFFSPKTDPQELYSCLYADYVMAKLLRHPGTDRYHLTSALARPLLRGGELPVFLYPSVQASSAINVAIPESTFDTGFEVIAVERRRLELNLGPGIAVTVGMQLSHDFSTDGDINWHSARRHRSTFSHRTGRHYDSEVVAWSVPPSWGELKAAA